MCPENLGVQPGHREKFVYDPLVLSPFSSARGTDKLRGVKGDSKTAPYRMSLNLNLTRHPMSWFLTFDDPITVAHGRPPTLRGAADHVIALPKKRGPVMIAPIAKALEQDEVVTPQTRRREAMKRL